MDAMVDDFMIFQQEELGKTQKNLDHNFSVFCEIWAAPPPPLNFTWCPGFVHPWLQGCSLRRFCRGYEFI